MLKKSQTIEETKKNIGELRKLLNKTLYDMKVLVENEKYTEKSISKLCKTQENLEVNKKIVKGYEHFRKELIFNIALAVGAAISAYVLYIIAEGIAIGSLLNQITVIVPRFLTFLGIPVPLTIGGIYYLVTIDKENKDIKEIVSYYLKKEDIINNKDNRLACKKEITRKQNVVSKKLAFAEEEQSEISKYKKLLQSLIDEIYDNIQTDEYQVEVAEMLRQQIGYYASPEEIDDFINIMIKSNGDQDNDPNLQVDFSTAPRSLTKAPRQQPIYRDPVHHVGNKGFGFVKHE